MDERHHAALNCSCNAAMILARLQKSQSSTRKELIAACGVSRPKNMCSAPMSDRPPTTAPSANVIKLEGNGGWCGIDFGTTYCCVGVLKGDGHCDILTDELGSQLIPSIVSFSPFDGTLSGSAAKLQASMNPNTTILNIKSLLGLVWNDPYVQHLRLNSPYVIHQHPNRSNDFFLVVTINGQPTPYTPEQIAGILFAKLRSLAEKSLAEKVVRAVVTVPAAFTIPQRAALMNSAKIGGFEEVKLLSEPTAACTAYGGALTEKDGKCKMLDSPNFHAGHNILVYDLGGSQLKVSIVTVVDEAKGGIINRQFQVKANVTPTPQSAVCGADFDDRIVQYLGGLALKKLPRLDLKKDVRAMRLLLDASERAKQWLSYHTEALIAIDNLLPSVQFRATISRARFEYLCGDLFSRATKLIPVVFAEAKLEKSAIHEIVLVGGSTRIPALRTAILSHFADAGPRPLALSTKLDPELIVAIGATVHSATVSGAYKRVEPVLRETCPESIGIESADHKFHKVLFRSTPYPVDGSVTVTTGCDHQKSISVNVFSGEHEIADRNRLIAILTVTGFPPLPKSAVQVDLTFRMEENGMLEVCAKPVELPGKHQLLVTVKAEAVYLDHEQTTFAIRRAQEERAGNAELLGKFEIRKKIEETVIKVLVLQQSLPSTPEMRVFLDDCDAFLDRISTPVGIALATKQELSERLVTIQSLLDANIESANVLANARRAKATVNPPSSSVLLDDSAEVQLPLRQQRP